MEDDEEGCITEDDDCCCSGSQPLTLPYPLSASSGRVESHPYETGAGSTGAPPVGVTANRRFNHRRPRYVEAERLNSDNFVPSTDILSDEPVAPPAKQPKVTPPQPIAWPVQQPAFLQPAHSMVIYVPTFSPDGSVALMPTWTTMPSAAFVQPQVVAPPVESSDAYMCGQYSIAPVPFAPEAQRIPPPPPPPPPIDPYYTINANTTTGFTPPPPEPMPIGPSQQVWPQTRPNPPTPPPPPSKADVPHTQARNEFYCAVCDRDFRYKNRYDLHMSEDHVPCEHCDWTGPPAMLVAHNLTHIRGRDGEMVCQSKAEEEAWLGARRRHREIKRSGGNLKKAKLPLSELETALRESMKVKKNFKVRLNANLLRRHPDDSGVVPQAHAYSRMFEAKKTESFEGPESSKQDQCRLWQEFNICESFLRHRKCKFGKACTKSHDVKRYQEWQINRVKSGIKVKFRHYNSQALMYKLTLPEIVKYEKLLLKCFKVLLKNDFWLQCSDAPTQYGET
eukprot:Blabericola_migrator_1__7570@NODE_386_length_9117_cov_178_340884_g309_i0_p2_GENE_NODE_386_length_9117_cov_178_340884_g309_i0NODE_386_length_9117_cov_178_340884_g309_i0_p2_ORF_typecomplete_len506_score84_53zfCCCH/PF00642_24/0_1OrsD/PF12013_8/1_2e03OrsD/PF12013_8/1_1OrsD/PF12013_8/7_4e03_NODE_386_length_9117_cov_178_340884_g309_i040275544